MAWIRVDDHFYENPTMASVGPLGWGVFVAGLAYCNRNLTDGFIPDRIAHGLAVADYTKDGTEHHLTEAEFVSPLLQAGVWEQTDGGYQVVGYLDWQPSREAILEHRNRDKNRKPRRQRGKETPANGHVPNDSTQNPTGIQLLRSKKEEVNLGAKAPSTSSSPSVEQGLFDYWREQCSHPNSRPTRERLAKIRARLAEGYDPAQIRAAIDGAANGAFVNESGKRFDDVELICRSGSKLESFIGRKSGGEVVPLARPAALVRADAWREGYDEDGAAS